MKKSVINLIKILGSGTTEIVTTLEVDNIIFDSIEWIETNDKVILHIFNGEYDYCCDFDELKLNEQIEVYYNLFMSSQ
jgi:hypothetical protein